MKLLSVLLIFALLTLRSVTFEGLASKSLYDFDEARYAEIAKNILKTGEWLVPMAGGPDDPQNIILATLPNGSSLHPYFWKPPLHTWMIATSYKLLGISELAVRLPSLMFALLSLILIYLICQKLFSTDKNRRFIGLLAILLLSSSNDFSYLSSQGVAEMQLAFFSLATIYYLLRDGLKNLLISSIALSLAFMTKSFAVFWLYPLCFYLIISRYRQLKPLLIWLGLQLLIILPWHLIMYQRFGWDFINHYVLTNIVGRGTGAQSNVAPIYWYIKYAFWQWKLHLLILPLLAIPFLKLIKNNSKTIIFFVLWMILVFVPFSLIKSKVWWYIFPFWIPFNILIAYLGSYYLKNLAKLTVTVIIIFLAINNYLVFKQTQSRSNWNQGLKEISRQHPALTNLAVYKIPYESPLFYFNTGEITRDINLNTRYVITNKDYFHQLTDSGEWQVLSFQLGNVLLERKDY